MICIIDSRYLISFVKIDSLMLELLSLNCINNSNVKAILAFCVTNLTFPQNYYIYWPTPFTQIPLTRERFPGGGINILYAWREKSKYPFSLIWIFWTLYRKLYLGFMLFSQNLASYYRQIRELEALKSWFQCTKMEKPCLLICESSTKYKNIAVLQAFLSVGKLSCQLGSKQVCSLQAIMKIE